MPATTTRPLDVPPGGSLGLLAFGYRGVAAWRAARGTAWIDELEQRNADDRDARQAAAAPVGEAVR